MSRPMGGGLRRGPVLPYRPLAGVVTCPGGWLVAGAKLQGITMSFEEPLIFSDLADVIDYRPSFEIIALHAPIGLLDGPRAGGRPCDTAARRLLGPRRGAAIASAPSRPLLVNGLPTTADELAGLSAVSRSLLPRYREVAREIQPYRQRTVFEVHPEVSFHQLNADAPLRYGKTTLLGRAERREILTARFPGVDSLLDASVKGVRERHLLDVAACLWTTRRIAARAVERLPADPVWDTEGFRMEIVR